MLSVLRAQKSILWIRFLLKNELIYIRHIVVDMSETMLEEVFVNKVILYER